MNETGPEGYTAFPSLYADYEQVGEYASWPQEALEDRQMAYSEFLEGDLMPRARTTAGLILMHLTFELDWRAEHA